MIKLIMDTVTFNGPQHHARVFDEFYSEMIEILPADSKATGIHITWKGDAWVSHLPCRLNGPMPSSSNTAQPWHSKSLHLNSKLEEIVETFGLSLGLVNRITPDIHAMSAY